ncbi:MAG: F0F1 ATP synthase subunit A [Deltaproteobacteria bacterium]|jgi:F-type H+-transporting ATPase subunit a|nr:F0F1 ATP synthase subunit A [Deltaproteobacteria bacterium]
MGEESTWFDYLPGLANLIAWAKQYLGREDPSQGFFFQGGPFVDSHFNLTHVFSALLVLAFVTLGAMSFSSAMRRGGDEAIVPPAKFSLRNLFEVVGDALWNLTRNIMGEENGRKYLPLIGTLACFIFFSNVLALIPGMVPPTSTLKTNVALALTVFVITHIEGIRAQGIVSYLKHFAGPIWWLAWIMIPIEIIGHLARPLSLSMRLMGNMVSDHKVVGVFFFLVPLLVPVPFLILGTMVAVIQTLVFCLLSMVYINMAVATHDHDDEHEGHGEHAHAH